MRTQETHRSHCASLGGPLHEHMATTYGVLRDSILNSLQYFHTTEGLVPDIMHDVLEGVLPMCVKHLLSNLIERSVISLTELNRRIDAYEFGAIEGANRPRGNITITHLTSGDLRQSGTHRHHEMCSSGRYSIVWLHSAFPLSTINSYRNVVLRTFPPTPSGRSCP